MGLLESLKALAHTQVLVGVPAAKTAREGDEEPITNAALAYIHDKGAPESNIPARPFMEPGIKAAQKRINKYLGQAGDAAMSGDKRKMLAAFNAAGLTASTSIKTKINTGPFQALALATIKARARRGRKGAQLYVEQLNAGIVPDPSLAKPLIDTAQMRNSITYVIRK